MEFEWDENKELKNIQKHGIDFKQASKIWSGPVVEIKRSNRSGEERTVAIGVYENRFYAVVYTKRGEAYRIISARRAHRRERAHYQNTLG